MILMKESRAGFVGTAAGSALVFLLPALLASPEEVIGNLVLFNFERVMDSTSVLFELPLVAGRVAFAVATVLALAIPIYWELWKKPKGVAATAWVTAASMVAFLAGSKILHRNFMLWLMPLFAVLLASTLFGRSEARDDLVSDTTLP